MSIDWHAEIVLSASVLFVRDGCFKLPDRCLQMCCICDFVLVIHWLAKGEILESTAESLAL